MKRNICCNKKEEGTEIDENKRSLIKERRQQMKSANAVARPRNVALS